MPLRDDGLDDIRLEEAKMRAAKDRFKFTRIDDMHAHVICAKASGSPIAVVWTNEHGTHVMGITDALNHSWVGRNYPQGEDYVEALCKQIAEEDMNSDV